MNVIRIVTDIHSNNIVISPILYIFIKYKLTVLKHFEKKHASEIDVEISISHLFLSNCVSNLGTLCLVEETWHSSKYVQRNPISWILKIFLKYESFKKFVFIYDMGSKMLSFKMRIRVKFTFVQKKKAEIQVFQPTHKDVGNASVKNEIINNLYTILVIY